MYVNNTGLPSVTEIIKPYIDTTWFTPEHSRRGSAVHAACGAHLQGLFVMPLPPEYQPYFDSFRRWCDTAVDTVILVEKRLSDKGRGYCGKPDAIVTLQGDDRPLLLDWKTSQAYQKWWMLQSTAYRKLAEGEEGIKTFRGASVRLKKDGTGCLLNWGPDDYRIDFNIFLGLLNAHHFFN